MNQRAKECTLRITTAFFMQSLATYSRTQMNSIRISIRSMQLCKKPSTLCLLGFLLLKFLHFTVYVHGLYVRTIRYFAFFVSRFNASSSTPSFVKGKVTSMQCTARENSSARFISAARQILGRKFRPVIRNSVIGV